MFAQDTLPTNANPEFLIQFIVPQHLPFGLSALASSQPAHVFEQHLTKPMFLICGLFLYMIRSESSLLSWDERQFTQCPLTAPSLSPACLHEVILHLHCRRSHQVSAECLWLELVFLDSMMVKSAHGTSSTATLYGQKHRTKHAACGELPAVNAFLVVLVASCLQAHRRFSDVVRFSNN